MGEIRGLEQQGGISPPFDSAARFRADMLAMGCTPVTRPPTPRTPAQLRTRDHQRQKRADAAGLTGREWRKAMGI